MYELTWRVIHLSPARFEIFVTLIIRPPLVSISCRRQCILKTERFVCSSGEILLHDWPYNKHLFHFISFHFVVKSYDGINAGIPQDKRDSGVSFLATSEIPLSLSLYMMLQVCCTSLCRGLSNFLVRSFFFLPLRVVGLLCVIAYFLQWSF